MNERISSEGAIPESPSGLPSNISATIDAVIVGEAYERFPKPLSDRLKTADSTLYGGSFRFIARDMDGFPTVSANFLSSRRIDSIGAVLERKLTPEQACNHSAAEAAKQGLRSTDPSVQCGDECRQHNTCILVWPLEIAYVGNQMIFFPDGGDAAASIGQPCNPQGFDDCQPMAELPYPLEISSTPVVLPASEWHTKLATYRDRLRETNGMMEVTVTLHKAGLHTVRLRVCEERCSETVSAWSDDDDLPWTVQIEGQCGPSMSPDDKDDCRCDAGFERGTSEYNCEQCPENSVKTGQSGLVDERCISCLALINQELGEQWDPNRVVTQEPRSDNDASGNQRPGARRLDDCLCRYVSMTTTNATNMC